MRKPTEAEVAEWLQPVQVTAKYIRECAIKASREIGKKEGYSQERIDELRKKVIRRATSAAKKHGFFAEAA